MSNTDPDELDRRAKDLYERADLAYSSARGKREDAEAALESFERQEDALRRMINSLRAEESSWEWRKLTAALIRKRIFDLTDRIRSGRRT